DAVADFQSLVFRAHLYNLAHEFMAHDVAGFHARHEAVIEMQVGAADGAARHPDDRIPRMLDFRIGDLVAADVLLAVPAKCFHRVLHRRRLPRCVRPEQTCRVFVPGRYGARNLRGERLFPGSGTGAAAWRFAMTSSKTTTDHEIIRQWAEQRGGRPSAVSGTGGRKDAGILQIDFPDRNEPDNLEEITWEEF